VHLWTGLATGIHFAFPGGFVSDNETSTALFIQDAIATVVRLHFGRAYGLFVKLLWTVLRLIPSALLITGFIMWLNRKVRR
jgi:uncharacterized iron-regulated membrane protein